MNLHSGYVFGGVMNPQTLPTNAVSCADHQWQEVEHVPPNYPRDLIRFQLTRQDERSSDSLLFHYDVDETGSAVNIRFVEPETYMRHATMRKAILASADAIEQWRFHAEGETAYVTGCTTRITFAY